MTVGQIIAEVMKRERITTLPMYLQTPMVEIAAAADIRPIVARTERIACAMADAQGRLSSGDDVKVFACQGNQGIQNAWGAVAQAYDEGVPLVVIVPGPTRALAAAKVPGIFSATLNFQHITKSVEMVTTPEMIVPVLRRAFTLARNGRPGPCLIEVCDVFNQEHPQIKTPAELDYQPTRRTLIAPDAAMVEAAADALLKAKMPVIYAGQGVHYAKAWPELRQVAELLEAPVCTSMEGKSAFPETHALALGAGGNSTTGPVAAHVRDSDLVFGVGVSFNTPFSIRWSQNTKGKDFIHNTVDEAVIDTIIPARYPLVGDAKIMLAMLHQALSGRLKGKPRGLLGQVTARIQAQREAWLKFWMPHLTSNDKPLSPYRVIYDLLQTVDVPNTVITHDAGSPREEMTPFWKPVTPLGYLGWGKVTQLGYGLGLAMGAKLARPNSLCMNWWGDAAIGMTGMDLETCVRNKIPIMSIVSTNFVYKTYLRSGKVASHEKYGTMNVSGNYADLAKALGCYAERVTEPDQIVHAIKNGIAATQKGTPAVLEFITRQTPNVVSSGQEGEPGYQRPADGGGGDDD